MTDGQTPAPGGPEGSTGRASEALTGVRGAAGQAAATGGMVDRTTEGKETTTSTDSIAGQGPQLGLGAGQAGGLGLHGDPDVGARAGSTGMMGGAAGSGMPGAFTRGGLAGGTGGGLGGVSGAGDGVSADNERNLTAGLAGTAGHQEGTAGEGPVPVLPAGASQVVSPRGDAGDAGDGGDDTTEAMGGGLLDRATAGRGGDVGGGLSGTG
jgi:hypothetical protein